MLGPVSWDKWKKINEDIITVIRAVDQETIPLVAGFDWAYDLNHIRYQPINAEGIGYVTHPYPMKRKPPWPDIPFLQLPGRFTLSGSFITL